MEYIPAIVSKESLYPVHTQVQVVPGSLALKHLEIEIQLLDIKERQVVRGEPSFVRCGCIERRLAPHAGESLNLWIPVHNKAAFLKVFVRRAERGLRALLLEIDAFLETDCLQRFLAKILDHWQDKFYAVLIGRKPLILQILFELPHIIGVNSEHIQRL